MLGVSPLEPVVLFDAMFTTGSTLTALIDYLDAQGIETDYVFTAAGGRYGKELVVPPAGQALCPCQSGHDHEGMSPESKSADSLALNFAPTSSTEALEEVVLPTDSLQEQSRKSHLYCAEMIRREKEAEQAVVN